MYNMSSDKAIEIRTFLRSLPKTELGNILITKEEWLKLSHRVSVESVGRKIGFHCSFDKVHDIIIMGANIEKVKAEKKLSIGIT